LEKAPELDLETLRPAQRVFRWCKWWYIYILAQTGSNLHKGVMGILVICIMNISPPPPELLGQCCYNIIFAAMFSQLRFFFWKFPLKGIGLILQSPEAFCSSPLWFIRSAAFHNDLNYKEKSVLGVRYRGGTYSVWHN